MQIDIYYRVKKIVSKNIGVVVTFTGETKPMISKLKLVICVGKSCGEIKSNKRKSTHRQVNENPAKL